MNLLHAVAAGRFQQVDGADDVDLGVEGRLAHRGAHVGQRGLVADDLRPHRGEDALKSLWVADVGLVERRGRVDIGQLAGAEVVQHRHLVARGEVSVDHVRSNEPGAAGNKNAHEKIPFLWVDVLPDYPKPRGSSNETGTTHVVGS